MAICCGGKTKNWQRGTAETKESVEKDAREGIRNEKICAPQKGVQGGSA